MESTSTLHEGLYFNKNLKENIYFMYFSIMINQLEKKYLY